MSSAMPVASPLTPFVAESVNDEVAELTAAFGQDNVVYTPSRGSAEAVVTVDKDDKTLKVTFMIPPGYPDRAPPLVVATIDGTRLPTLDIGSLWTPGVTICRALVDYLLELHLHSHECSICFDDCKPSELSCQHHTCDECQTEYLKMCHNSKRGCPILCCVPNCHEEIPEPELRRLMTKDIYDSHMDGLTRRAIAQMTDMTLCLKCSMPADVQDNRAICIECHFQFCIKCHQNYHPGSPCLSTSQIAYNRMMETATKAEYDEFCQKMQEAKKNRLIVNEELAETVIKMKQELYTRAKANLTLLSDLKAIMELTRPCPGCNFPIQKNGGCNHMHCTKCNKSFNWESAMRFSLDIYGSRSPTLKITSKANQAKNPFNSYEGVYTMSIRLLIRAAQHEATRKQKKPDLSFIARCPKCLFMNVKVDTLNRIGCFKCLHPLCLECGANGKDELKDHNKVGGCPQHSELVLPEETPEMRPHERPSALIGRVVDTLAMFRSVALHNESQANSKRLTSIADQKIQAQVKDLTEENLIYERIEAVLARMRLEDVKNKNKQEESEEPEHKAKKQKKSEHEELETVVPELPADVKKYLPWAEAEIHRTPITEKEVLEIHQVLLEKEERWEEVRQKRLEERKKDAKNMPQVDRRAPFDRSQLFQFYF